MNFKGVTANLFITIVLLTVFYFLIEKKQDKLGYVKFGVLYEEFQMKKDFEGKIKNMQEKRKSILDSLEIELTFLSKKIENAAKISKEDVTDFNYKKEVYFQKKQQFGEDNQAAVDQYNEQIFKKINEYVINYGKQNGYTFIFGADGSANLMHALDDKDITTEVAKFINASYGGKND